MSYTGTLKPQERPGTYTPKESHVHDLSEDGVGI